MNHNQALDALPLFALGVLEAQETLAVTHYVQQQTAFLDQLRVTEAAVQLLAHAAPAVRVESTVRQKLLQRIQERIQADSGANLPVQPPSGPPPVAIPLPPLAANGAIMPTSLPLFDPTLDPKAPLLPARWVPPDPTTSAPQYLSAPLLPVPAESAGPQNSLPPRVGLRGNRWLWGLLAFAACCAAVIIIWDGVQTRRALQQNQLTLATTLAQARTEAGNAALLKTANQELTATVAQATNTLQAEQQRLQLMSTADRIYLLQGGNRAPDLRGTFYIKGQQGALVLAGLQPPPPGQSYQLWQVTANEQYLPISLLSADLFADLLAQTKGQGLYWLNFTLPTSTSVFSRVAISLEPASGSGAPTTPILLASQSN